MKAYRFILVALMGILMYSCKNEPSYYVSDIQAKWLENGTDHYVRFTSDPSNSTGYMWGYEWTSSEYDESDLFDPTMYHGDGWFEYQMEKKGNLHELHLMSNNGAIIPKEYVISRLTSTEMEYYEDGNKKNKFYFTKQ